MNKSLLSNSFTLFFLLLCIATHGQTFTGVYTFANVTTMSGKTDPTPVPVATGVTFGSFHVVGNPNSNPNSPGRFNFTQWPTATTINLSEYYELVIAPQPNYALTLSTLTFTVQRSGTGITQFSVRSSIDNYSSNLPASYTGTEYTVDTNNVFKIVSTATTGAIANLRITFNNVSNATSPDTVRFYGWGASAPTGTFSLNRAEFAGAATPAAGTPLLILDTGSLRFPSIPPFTTSPALQYTIKGNNLSDPVTVTASGPYSVSDALNGTYSTSVTLPAGDVATPKAVFVKFTPVSVGAFTGTISNSSTGAATVNVALNGQGIDPANLDFNFNTCTAMGMPSGGFISYSVTGSQVFACTQFGNNLTNGVDVNGYAGGPVDDEDWLISPPLNIQNLVTPILAFYSRVEFSGPLLQLLVSTDYDGYSNPNNFTWTDLQAGFPTVLNTWTLTDGINLSAYKSSSRLYVAFKYISSPDLGAARWTLDDISISNRSKIISVSRNALNFGEVTAGSSSLSQTFSVQGFGYGNINVIAPEGYLLSADNTSFSSTIQITETIFQAGINIYAKFSPQTKALRVEGRVRFTGNGLDSALLALTGSSYPKAETFDAGAYNLSFFGSNPTNNPTPAKITTQINNIATVFQHLNLDVVGVEEVSSDSAMAVLTSKLPGYAYILSNRWSYSFEPPSPGFPAQKVGFLYNTSTMKLVEQRVMMEGLYDSLRNNLATLPGYPDSVSHFWASGRLPFMATFDVTIGGISKRVRMIDIHAKSASDATSYNRRVYDVRLLKDSLDTYYKDDNIILVGDYNDRVYGSIYAGGVSPYRIFVNDVNNYSTLTYPLDSAGRVSFISGTGLIDHIIISNELKRSSIAGSTDIEDARTYISVYNATTASDHLPIFTRLTLTDQAIPLSVKLTNFYAEPQGNAVLLSWKTEQENNNDHFNVERSIDGRNYYLLATVPGAGTTTSSHNYRQVDSFPVTGINYYRLQQVDADGRSVFSNTVAVKMGSTPNHLLLYPNPVKNHLHLSGIPSATNYAARVTALDGKIIFETKGTIRLISQFMNQQLSKMNAGMYILHLKSADAQHSITFIRQ